MNNNEITDQEIKKRFFVTILFLFFLSISSAIYLFASFISDKNAKNINHHSFIEISRFVNNTIETRLDLLGKLSLKEEIRNFMLNSSNLSTQAIQGLLNKIKEENDLDIAYLMDIKGNVVACSIYGNGKTLKGKNYKFRPYFTDAFNNNYVIYPALGVTTGKRGIYLSTKIYDSVSNKNIGVLVFKISVSKIDKYLKKYNSPKFLVLGNNIVFASNVKSLLYSSLKPLNLDEKKELNNSKQFAGKDIKPLPFDINKNVFYFNNSKYLLEKDIILGEKGWQVFSLRKKGIANNLPKKDFVLFIYVLFLLVFIAGYYLYRKIFLTFVIGENIKRGTILYISMSFLLMMILSGILFFHFEEDTLEEEVNKKIDEIYIEYKNELNLSASIISTYIDFIDENTDIIEAYKKRDRTTLYNISKPILNRLRKKYNITHFYFHDLNRVNFLRVHYPERFGDLIKRKTMFDAYNKGIESSGIELGPLGLFTLRVVRPWIVDGKLIGYIEIGKEITEIYDDISMGENIDIINLIKKRYLDKNSWQEGQASLGNETKWNQFSDIVITHSTIKRLPVNISIYIDNFSKHMQTSDLDKLFKFKTYNRLLYGKLLPLVDAQGLNVGYLFVVQDETISYKRVVKNVWMEFLLILPIVVLLVMFLWVYLDHIENKIKISRKSLDNKILELEVSQQELKSEKEREELFLRVVPSAVFTVDKNNVITTWNNKIAQITGYSKDEAIGKKCSLFAYEPCNDKCTLFSDDVEKPCSGKEATIKTKKGDIITVSKNIDYLRDLSGEIIGGIESFEDITEKKRLESEREGAYQELQSALELSEAFRRDLEKATAEAQQAAKAKADFLANMSHEIRTPMNAILGFSDLLSITKLDSKQREYMDIVKSSGEHLMGIINDILDFSKIDAGKMILENIDFNFKYLVRDVFKMVVTRMKGRPFDTYIDIADDVPVNLKGDPTKLRQIIVNLLGNAIKFTSEGSIGLIAMKEEAPANSKYKDGMLKIIVKDTGIGIPKDKIYKIFQSFSQADESTTRKYGGTGLGLTISKSIVNQMGGHIWVESEEGKGSSFIFTLPIVLGTPQKDKDIHPLKNENIRKKKVLIVDDNEVARKIHTKCCTLLEMNIVSIEDSAYSALDRLNKLEKEANLPDLIICDIFMKGMDGYKFASNIRENKELSNIKMIAITSDPRIGEADYAKKRGFDGYLSKPVMIEDLSNVIATVLGDAREGGSIITKHMASELICRDIKILVVEDSIPNQMLFQAYFDELGCKGDYANNGQEAIDKLKDKNKYDIVLMDMQMPVMGGVEATKIIREKIDKEIPIIAVTASVLQKDKDMAKNVGMNAFLTKPINIDNLKKMILKYNNRG